MRLRRSLLFVCGADPEALEAGRRTAADGLILDLEDTVTPDKKPLARRLVAAFLRAPAHAGLERAVRINPPSTPAFEDDVAAVVAAGADALVIPKVESPEDVQQVERQLVHAERQAGRTAHAVKLLALVETPLGVLNAYAIATCFARRRYGRLCTHWRTGTRGSTSSTRRAAHSVMRRPPQLGQKPGPCRRARRRAAGSPQR